MKSSTVLAESRLGSAFHKRLFPAATPPPIPDDKDFTDSKGSEGPF